MSRGPLGACSGGAGRDLGPHSLARRSLRDKGTPARTQGLDEQETSPALCVEADVLDAGHCAVAVPDFHYDAMPARQQPQAHWRNAWDPASGVPAPLKAL